MQSYLQVKCARLTHAAAVMTTLKCFLFLERPQNATALAASFRPTVSTLERVSALAPGKFCRPHPGAVHLLGPPAYTYAVLKVLVAGGRAELSCRDAGTQTPTLPHTAE